MASDAFVGQAVEVDVQRGGLVPEVLLQLLLLLLSISISMPFLGGSIWKPWSESMGDESGIIHYHEE